MMDEWREEDDCKEDFVFAFLFPCNMLLFTILLSLLLLLHLYLLLLLLLFPKQLPAVGILTDS